MMVFILLILLMLPVQLVAAPMVIISQVESAEISDNVEALGTLKANESVEVTATVTEKITAIHFDDGKRVEADETLVEMTNDEEHALLNEARATLNEARKQFRRFKELAASNSASKSILDQRRREMETARARLEAIESRMSDRLVKAPFAGVVGLRDISVGALVEPGDRITTLYDDSQMKLDFSVPSTFLSALKIGLPIVAQSRSFGEEKFRGTVSSINPAIDPITRSIVVRAILPNEGKKLIPGMLMSVELFKNPRQALTVPEEAIVMEGKKHYVFVVGDDLLADKRLIKIGTRFRGSAEVIDGLSAGEKIVVRGVMNVRPGQVVSVRAQDKGDESLTEMLKQESAAK